MGRVRNILRPTKVLDAEDVWHKVEDSSERIWDTDLAKGVLSLFVACGQWSPSDSRTYYFGGHPYKDPQTTQGLFKLWVPANLHVTAAYLNWFADAINGSNEEIALYLLVNGATPYLIDTVADTSDSKLFSNSAMNVYLVPGDYIEIAIDTPAWATNPTGVSIGGNIYGVAS